MAQDITTNFVNPEDRMEDEINNHSKRIDRFSYADELSNDDYDFINDHNISSYNDEYCD